jgi:hypothetical protein
MVNHPKYTKISTSLVVLILVIICVYGIVVITKNSVTRQIESIEIFFAKNNFDGFVNLIMFGEHVHNMKFFMKSTHPP